MPALVRIAAVVATGALVGALLPPVRAGVKAFAVTAEVLELPVPRPLAPEIVRAEVELGGVPGHLYAPRRGSSPPIVLVPGATPQGLADTRVIRVAESLVRARRTVVLPELELYDEELVRADVERIVEMTSAVIDGPDEGVVILGISYGGSLGVLAAADAPVHDAVKSVAVFGAYADLVGLLQAITTGASLVQGERIPWDGHPDALDVLRERVVELLPPAERERFRQALAREIDPADLPHASRALYELVVNEDPARTFGLAEQLPAAMRARIAELSPSSVLDRLDTDVLVLHAVDDPLVPYAEALRFAEHRPDARVYPLDTFGHVGAETTSPREWLRAVRDFVRVWRFTTRLIRPQEGLLPAMITWEGRVADSADL